ncbi:MAG: acetate--CoA ligase family protein [Anaerolineae bacterium]|nr:acetate--CoA ligase family protein [Anaerolineae bacterium]
MSNQLEYFFKPASVALIGASSNPSKLSHGILINMLQSGYQGKVYPVNPGSKEIAGLTCYPDIESLPGPVDLGVVVLPAPRVLESLKACGQKGFKNIIIISGGFKEVGPEGAELERLCLEVAKQFKMRLIGPNCVGAMDLYSGLNTTFIKGLPDKGGISLVSQSGAVSGAIVDLICGKGIGISHLVSLGNEADVTETDVIEYLSEVPESSVIACYVEAIREGQRFIDVCRQVSRNKPIVLLKAGQTNAGARAVSSHTGSLAGSLAAYQAAIKQSGVIMVQTASELINVAQAFASQPLLKGNRVVVITNAGGPAALASDSLAQHAIQLADLSDSTRQNLRSRLTPAAQIANPVDMLGGAEPAEYGFAVEQCLLDDQVDAVLAIHVPTSVVNPDEIARAIGEAAIKYQKPVLACIMGEYSVGNSRSVLQGFNVPCFQYPDQMGVILGAMYNYTQIKNKTAQPPLVNPAQTARPLSEIGIGDHKKELGEAHIRPLLAAYDFPLIRAEIAHDESEVSSIAAGFASPIVMKIVSPDVLHKSDAGGIRLNIQSPTAAIQAYHEIINNIKNNLPSARIEGVIMEPMAPRGQEVIIGMKRDPQFGPLIMFGLGGIYVELFGDVAFRVAPITREDAFEMVRETKAGKLLAGMRGHKPADIEAVVDCLLKLARISLDYPEIEEIEINPLLVLDAGQGVLALDARAIKK